MGEGEEGVPLVEEKFLGVTLHFLLVFALFACGVGTVGMQGGLLVAESVFLCVQYEPACHCFLLWLCFLVLSCLVL